MIISAKSKFNWLKWFLTRRFLKFRPIRTHYGPWQPCWISNQHQKHKSGRGPSSEHFWQVWLKSVQRFQRRRFKCEKLTDGRKYERTTDAYPWQKLIWPMARWAKNDKLSIFCIYGKHRKSQSMKDLRTLVIWHLFTLMS